MFKKSTLNLNSPQSLSIIEDEGNVIHRQPIKCVYELTTSDLDANKAYKFSLSKFGRDLMPIVLAVSSTTTTNQNNSFVIKIFDGSTYLWGLNLANKKSIDLVHESKGFVFHFPPFFLRHDYTVEITSEVALVRVSIFCEPIYIENEMIKTD